MNKIEIELTEALLKVESDVGKLISYNGTSSYTTNLIADLAAFKAILWKLLDSED